ncbi:unnamed protein product [Cyprideis torosa]|uniref:Uncharacterized protein n=1 Tax=Cyprideis torosa TaxID=163714 RepID=A0A7R8ZMP3_9CRUS|nr:unnamed protein product [Cyprideis torosa]CAG0889455.1 unnamed protein product [Cyprideis torosa]
MLLLVIGVSATTNTSFELSIAGNDRTHKETFYQADGGTQLAARLVEESLGTPGGFSALSKNASTKDVLVDPTNPNATILIVDTTLSENHSRRDETSLSDSSRDVAYYPNGYDAAKPDAIPHTNIIVDGTTSVAPNAGLQMIAGYEGLSFAEVSSETNASFTSEPINLTGNDVTPLVMMNVSRDHQLSYKAYNDYSDLDGDSKAEITYQDSIEYYGYFDSKKCYTYDTEGNRFVPAEMATGSNNHYCTGEKWSGNFMNWATMTRMDVVRKMLYGGMRSEDTATSTVLERHYLPTDAHAFAKYYKGDDIDKLTPFSGIVTEPPEGAISTSTTSLEFPTHTSGSRNLTFATTTTFSASVGNYILVSSTNVRVPGWIGGEVTKNKNGKLTVKVPAGAFFGTGTSASWKVENLNLLGETGITLCNMTLGEKSGDDRYSDTNTKAPMIRVASGNFSLWTANERWQCYWSEEKTATNKNIPYLSGIYASPRNPSQTTHGLGTGSGKGEYTARVEVCKEGLLGGEKCKKYGSSGSSYKPIGLLQVYGDDDQINFGLFTGTFDKNISGGVLRKNATSFTNEINVSDGTFITDAEGIVANLNKLRIYGYDYSDGTYIHHDYCTYQQTGLVASGGERKGGKPANEGNCSSWGNPMSEIYLESIRYLAGKSANAAFTDTNRTKDLALGLTDEAWSDPLDANNYCAALNVLNFNASVSSYDGNQLDTLSDILPADSSEDAKKLTDAVGSAEGIDTSSWFVGNNGQTDNDLCSSKDKGSGFGSFSGLCPEAPTQEGTYRMAGIAHYANTNRIRSDLKVASSRKNSRDLMVSTYGIALATNVPKIEVSANGKKVTILPAYRLDVSSTGSGPFGGGTLVDFKIISDDGISGKFYVNWEDSEMGGDYDQDMWGIIEYKVDGDTITITTNAIAESTVKGQGFGYIISGTNKDGPHFHSGIEKFDYTDTTGVTGCTNCQVGDGPTSVSYTIQGGSAGVLQDPLWYAAKWGGFYDSNGNKKPDLQSEWDETNNSDGSSGPDGLPDNYFYATNPLQLEKSLNRVFLTILQRASSGTAAAVVSNNVSGVGALYQAYYEPLRQDEKNRKASWIGTVQALWLDDFGYLREDDGDAVLENYTIDPVIQQFYDEEENRTKFRRFKSTKDTAFTPFYMQGEVSAFDATSGSVTFTVEKMSGAVGSGAFGDWIVYNLSTGRTFTSTTTTSILPLGTSVTFDTPKITGLFVNGDTIRVAHLEYDEVSIDNIGTLWNAREQLSFDDVDGTYATTQRMFSFPADGDSNGGRYIKTWLDDDGDGIVDTDEFVDFTGQAFTSDRYGYLNVASKKDGENLVDYVRGKEIDGYRNRTIDYSNSGTQVMRLADIVNATPTVVGAPQEALDLLYKDETYATFKKQYAKRRQVLYVGSNGGMLHAFNGGFYDSAARSFSTSGKDYKGNSVTQHPLGAEIWAYVPMNLLPHLKWLKDPDYTHVYYVDGKPKVFDAKIFDNDDDHPEGWGTVLVVGMRFGGGKMTVDTKADGLGGEDNNDDDRLFSSAYIIMDITNPEVEPKLLAEIQVPDESFSTSYPAAFTVKEKKNTGINKWFLTFGSGPTALGGESTQSAKVFIFDLDEIRSPGTTSGPSKGCVEKDIGSGGNMRILSCDTGVSDSFVGDPATVDWNLDYRADAIYFGLVGGTGSDSGQVMRLDINNAHTPGSWGAPTTVINTSQPVAIGVTPAVDGTGQRWLFFGTGRFLVKGDQTSTSTQSIYGVKEKKVPVKTTDLLDVTAAKIQTDGSVSGLGTATKFDDLEDDIETNREGWYLNLPTIHGVAGTAPATRVINGMALAGGVLFSTAYQPGIDLCTGEGFSRLYGLYYKTGTAYPDPDILGAHTDISGREYAKPYIELGHGFATTPSLHTGSRSGEDAVSVFTQLSTGAIVRTEATTVKSVRSGFRSWSE